MTTFPVWRVFAFRAVQAGLSLALLGATATAAFAQDKPKPGWAIDPKTGCKVWDDLLEAGEAIHWSGECPKGVAEGRGTAQWVLKGKNEENYDGDMRDGKMNGHGTLVFPNGLHYEGAFKDNDFDGRGKLTFSNGDVYEGEFAADDRSGQGTFTMTDGRRYVGEWKADMPDGQGVLTRRDGTPVSGKWKMGCLSEGATKAAVVATPKECKIY
ncbi:hypothetical protein BH11PSE3_BH11PSE3_25080 [soil metagenome]